MHSARFYLRSMHPRPSSKSADRCPLRTLPVPGDLPALSRTTAKLSIPDHDSCLPFPVAVWLISNLTLLPSFLIVRLSLTILLSASPLSLCPADYPPGSGPTTTTTCVCPPSPSHTYLCPRSSFTRVPTLVSSLQHHPRLLYSVTCVPALMLPVVSYYTVL